MGVFIRLATNEKNMEPQFFMHLSCASYMPGTGLNKTLDLALLLMIFYNEGKKLNRDHAIHASFHRDIGNSLA